jgi:signal transduction histidine kinase
MRDLKPHSKRLGLRARVTLAFATIALFVCAALAILTDALVRHNVHHHQWTVDLAQTRTNASLLHQRLGTNSPSVAVDELTQVSALVSVDGRWYSTPSGPNPDAIPHSLRQDVLHGDVVQQRLHRGSGAHMVAVGVPLQVGTMAYIQLFDVSEADRTLRVLGATLFAVSATTTIIAGLAGWWISNRVLQPVGEVAGAAADLAAGRLNTRLEGSADPDLAVVAGAFNAMADALQERIERDNRFASDVSHELRSPLTTLANATQVLVTRRQELSERSRTALDLLVSEVDRFQRLVTDLLEMARLDAGVVPVELEEVGVGDLVTRAVVRIGSRSGEEASARPVDIEPAAAHLAAALDKRRLMRVLTNLIDNAEKHGGGLSRVAVEASGGEVLIAIEDRGPGIPSGESQRIFERFARTAATGRRASRDGAGLGLSLVAEHVAAQRGRIWVEERPGGGARFVVALPVERQGGS